MDTEMPYVCICQLNQGNRKNATPCVCVQVRGDLLVWSQGLEALLTTNLKRLKANPDPEEDQVYQLLLCTSPPLSPVLRLLPDRDGVHVALQCADGLSVVRLARHRGEFGEFGAGTHTVNCKYALSLQEVCVYECSCVHVLVHVGKRMCTC